MKYLLILLALLAAPLARAETSAQGFNLGSFMQAAQHMAANGQGGTAAAPATGTTSMLTQAQTAAQTAMVQQAVQQLAANPQLLSQMAGSLSAPQQASLMQQAMAIGNNIFTPQEQAKLAAFTSTPEGASIASKIPTLVQQLAPVVLQMYAQQGTNVAPAAGK